MKGDEVRYVCYSNKQQYEKVRHSFMGRELVYMCEMQCIGYGYGFWIWIV